MVLVQYLVHLEEEVVVQPPAAAEEVEPLRQVAMVVPTAVAMVIAEALGAVQELVERAVAAAMAEAAVATEVEEEVVIVPAAEIMEAPTEGTEVTAAADTWGELVAPAGKAVQQAMVVMEAA